MQVWLWNESVLQKITRPVARNTLPATSKKFMRIGALRIYINVSTGGLDLNILNFNSCCEVTKYILGLLMFFFFYNDDER